MRGLSRKAACAVMAGLMAVGGALAPVGVVLGPTTALAGTAVAEGNHGTRVVGWHYATSDNSMTVHVKVEGLGDGAVMPTRAVDPYGNEFAFDDTGEAVFQVAILMDSETGDSVACVLPVGENVSDWQYRNDDGDEYFGHHVNGSWTRVEMDDVLLQGYDTEAIKRLIGDPPVGGDVGSVWTYGFFNAMDVALDDSYGGPNACWKVQYTDGTSFDAFALSWSNDARNLATTENNKAVFPVPSPMLYESDQSDPYAGAQTGTGETSLNMVLEDAREHGGTAVDSSNPDELGGGADGQSPDGLGDNLAFTVPSSINYVVKADGSLVGPSEGVAFIENKSAFPARVSSVDVDAETGFTFVADASVSNAANSVDMQFGPVADMLQASSYLTKADVATPSEWGMASVGTADASKVLLRTEGDVAHISEDITSQTQFGTIKWYLTPGLPA